MISGAAEQLFIHQTQVAAAIHQCNGGDDFVKERNGLSYNVRKVCQPLMDNDEDYERNLATLEAICMVSLANIPPKIASLQPPGLHYAFICLKCCSRRAEFKSDVHLIFYFYTQMPVVACRAGGSFKSHQG